MKNRSKQLRKLDKPVAIKILDYLEQLTFVADVRSQGKALSGNLAVLWRYRVGDYRIICDIADQEITVYVIDIGHRKDIYR